MIEYEQHPIRLIGLSVSNPKEEADEQHGVWEQLSLNLAIGIEGEEEEIEE